MNQKLKSMDIIKGIGIIMIIIVHNRHFLMQDMSGLRPLINYGQMGCQLFLLCVGIFPLLRMGASVRTPPHFKICALCAAPLSEARTGLPVFYDNPFQPEYTVDPCAELPCRIYHEPYAARHSHQCILSARTLS